MATLEAPLRLRTRAHSGPFRNEPGTDFSRSEVARQMRAALDRVRGQLGREYDLILPGVRSLRRTLIRSYSRPNWPRTRTNAARTSRPPPALVRSVPGSLRKGPGAHLTGRQGRL